MTTHLSENSLRGALSVPASLDFMQKIPVALAILPCAVGGSIVQRLLRVSESLRGLAVSAQSRIESSATPYTHPDIILPCLHIRPDNPAVVGQHPIKLALHICRLSPNSTRARVELDLQQQLAQQEVTAEVPIVERGVHLVSLVDAVDRILDLPKMLR